jgi:3D-(3,5/4)-trihydroxycyclohexane-1,2-dione acylhydrolase (decyclizing)
MPQDVQTEAHDYPIDFFEPREWHVARNRADRVMLARAAETIRSAKQPLIVAGGGVTYSDANAALKKFVEATGIPVCETMAGKGALRYDHTLQLGAVGATGTFAANEIAEGADVVIGIGTRYSDFTTASKTQFQNPHVRFININVSAFDAGKHSGLQLIGDARECIEALTKALRGWQMADDYRARVTQLHDAWEQTVDEQYAIRHTPLPSQSELIGAVNTRSDKNAIMVCAAGSLPGDLHKLWRASTPKNYHLEYGYSTMGYEIAGGLGAKMAAPERDVIVMVGDGSYLMMNQEIVTSVQENYKLIIVLLDNDGYKSIGSLSRSLGQHGFGTRYVYPSDNILPDDRDGAQVCTLPIDLASNAESLGAIVLRCEGYAQFCKALKKAKKTDRTTVIYIRNDRYAGVPGYGWWDVPPSEVSEMLSVQESRREWEKGRAKERIF